LYLSCCTCPVLPVLSCLSSSACSIQAVLVVGCLHQPVFCHITKILQCESHENPRDSYRNIIRRDAQ
jgi:hypothetical protein